MAENPNLDGSLECLAFQLSDMKIEVVNLSDAQLVATATSLLKAMDEIMAAAPISDGMRKAIYNSVASAIVSGSRIAD